MDLLNEASFRANVVGGKYEDWPGAGGYDENRSKDMPESCAQAKEQEEEGYVEQALCQVSCTGQVYGKRSRDDSQRNQY